MKVNEKEKRKKERRKREEKREKVYFLSSFSWLVNVLIPFSSASELFA